MSFDVTLTTAFGQTTQLTVSVEDDAPDNVQWTVTTADATVQPGTSLYLLTGNLLNADGSDFWTKDMPNHERWRLFRRLKVSDFEYVPAKRAWRFLKP